MIALTLADAPTLQVSFEQDVELSQINEYEVLQLLMGDCRDRLQTYKLSTEEEIKVSQVSCVCVGWLVGWLT
jgi:histone-lysine N-methyltransferase SETD3